MKHSLWFAVVAVVAALCVGCADTECTTTNTAYVHYGFYSQSGSHISITGAVTVTAAGTDSVLINQESGLSAMELPLRYTSTRDTFVVRYSDTMIDSVYVEHENIPHFISMDCGMGMYYHIAGVSSTHYAIDSIKLVNQDVNYDAAEHIKIYYTYNN